MTTIYHVGGVDGARVGIEETPDGYASITLATDYAREPQALRTIAARSLAALLVTAASIVEKKNARAARRRRTP